MLEIIGINQTNESDEIVEDYHSFDEDDVVSILSMVCEQIDRIKLAKIKCLFAKEDTAFTHLDFSYDLTSVIHELEELVDWIEAYDNTSFVLYFYEIQRKVYFSFRDENTVNYKIIHDTSANITAENHVSKVLLKQMTHNVLKDFRALMKRYFPKASAMFRADAFLGFDT